MSGRQTLQSENNPLIPIGEIGKPWGLLGFSRLHLYHQTSRALHDECELYLQDLKNQNPPMSFEKITLESVRRQGKNYLIRIQGHSTPEQAKKVQGFRLFVSKNALPQLKKDEHYAFELVGREVHSSSQNLGKVESVVNYGASDLLLIKKGTNELLIPFISEFIRAVQEDKILVDWEPLDFS